MVNVVGHADDLPVHSGRFSNNWELSGMRACEVTRFLIEETGIPGERFYISAHAYHQPLVPNNSSENRAANRRVEIIMTPEKPTGHMPVHGEVPGLGVDELIQKVGFGYH
jgi:chemotaxis protein MotB